MFPRFTWKRNHKCEQPSRVVFYDTETTAFPDDSDPSFMRHRLTLGVAAFWRNIKGIWQRDSLLRFTSGEQFFDAMYDFCRSRRPVWAYAHNAGFDFTIVGGFAEIDKGVLRIYERNEIPQSERKPGGPSYREWKGKTALDGVPFLLETRCDQGTIKWVDSYNYWPVPLATLGKRIGHEKLEFPDWSQDNEDVFRYCERDVEIVEKSVLSLMNFWKRHDLGNWQPTAASLAYSAFRHGKESHQITGHGDRKMNVDDKLRAEKVIGQSILDAYDVTECERRAYYGGRTCVYFLGDIVAQSIPASNTVVSLYDSGRAVTTGPVTVLDVNGMFPYVMREYLHPVELIDAIRSPQFSVAQRLCEEFPCCADVEIDSDDTAYPVRIGGNLGFVTGKFATSLIGPELSEAVSAGHVRAFANLCVYQSGRPFSNFCRDWTERRESYLEAGRDIDAGFCKLIMNSLYGKLAQKTPLWITTGMPGCGPRWGSYIGKPFLGGEPCIMRAIGGVSQYQDKPRSCRHTFVAAAASVAASARHYLNYLIRLCPSKSVVYTDTDSLFCLPPAVEALKSHGLLHQTENGKLKSKGTYSVVRIWGLKDYELDGQRIIAGLKADAKQLSERLWEQVNFEGVKQIVQHEPDGTILQNTVRFAPTVTIPFHDRNWDGWCDPVRVD